VVGRLPLAAARQGLAPSFLGYIHPRTGTPIAALVLNSVITSLLVFLYFSGTLLDAYVIISQAATATALVAIAVACLSEVALVRREPERFSPRQRSFGPVVAIIGFLAVLLMIVGTGLYPWPEHWYMNVWLLTLLSVLLTVPLFALLRNRHAEGASPTRS